MVFGKSHVAIELNLAHTGRYEGVQSNQRRGFFGVYPGNRK